MALVVNPTSSVIAAQATGGPTPGVVLQPGAVINAEVLKVAENLVQIAIAGLALDVVSEIPLEVGQNLQLAVSQTEGGAIRLAVVGQGTAAAPSEGENVATNAPVSAPANVPATLATIVTRPSDLLSPLERIAVSVASENAATRQESLAPLFANLNAAAASNNLPPALQEAVAQVLVQQTSLDPNLTGNDIQTAFEKSGLFLEASLASGSVSSGSVPDLKAALIVLRQTLAAAIVSPETAPSAVAPAILQASPSETGPAPTVQTTRTPQTAASPSLVPSPSEEVDARGISPAQLRLPLAGDANAANVSRLVLAEALLSAGPRSVTSGVALNLLQEAQQQQFPRAAGGALTATIATVDDRSEAAIVHTSTPPPPFRGGLPSAQPVASATILQNAPLATTARHLLDDTDAALARQTLLQVASLPDRIDGSTGRTDASMPRWNFEIPFATPQGAAMTQFEISRDGGNEVDAAKRVWRARFSLDVEPAGPVHALISFSEGRTSVRMWAERPQTAAQLRAGAAELSQALSQAELPPGDIVIREGAPPQAQPARAGHFLDRAL